MRRIFWTLAVVLLIAACGKNPPAPQWPAKLVSVTGFSEAQKSQVMKAIQNLNDGLGHQAVDVSGQGNGFPITIHYVESFSDAPLRAGLTAVSTQGADIA